MTATASAIRSARALVDLLYPAACLLCQAAIHGSASPVCESCHAAMPRGLAPVCARCGLGLPGAYDAHLVCPACQRHPPVFEQARAPFVYARAVPDAIKTFKYRGRHRLGVWLAVQMAEEARRHARFAEVQAVIPVPLHWLTRRLRGFDPPIALARMIARLLGIPYVPLLRRSRWTATQTRLSPSARARNVEGAFRVNARPRPSGGVLLIDDVLTSGATANACAQALRRAGIRPVYVLTAARTPIHP